MQPLPETYTVRTRDGQEYTGLTMASLRIAAAQKIFSLEDGVRPDRMAGSWSPLARMLSLPDPGSVPEAPRASTGIALDLAPQAPQTPREPQPPPVSPPLHPVESERPSAEIEADKGPTRHRLRLAGTFLLVFGLLGIATYVLGKRGPLESVVMLVNTGLGIALLMNLPQARRWAAGWVLAGWALSVSGAALAGGCLGLVLGGLLAGLGFGGPLCLLWGENCPRGRFWVGVSLMAMLFLLVVLGLALVAVSGAAMVQRLRM